MKKWMILFAAAFIVGSGSLVLANEQDGDMGDGKGMMGDKMMMMHKMMGEKSMVSSNDGGVIVLIGNTLYKYDKNLKLIKQVDLSCSMGMGDKKMCPMKGKMGQEKEGADKASDAQEHEAHHPEK